MDCPNCGSKLVTPEASTIHFGNFGDLPKVYVLVCPKCECRAVFSTKTDKMVRFRINGKTVNIEEVK